MRETHSSEIGSFAERFKNYLTFAEVYGSKLRSLFDKYSLVVFLMII